MGVSVLQLYVNYNLDLENITNIKADLCDCGENLGLCVFIVIL